jgi:hypothetical protein
MLSSALVALATACSEPPAPPQGPAKAPPAPLTTVGVGSPVAQTGQPKPGERVRQPLLDDHCADTTAPVAFYYHGGRPFAQRALGDGCRPLYITECEDNGECSQGSEQEQGMWCCGDPSPATAHADRR